MGSVLSPVLGAGLLHWPWQLPWECHVWVSANTRVLGILPFRPKSPLNSLIPFLGSQGQGLILVPVVLEAPGDFSRT